MFENMDISSFIYKKHRLEQETESPTLKSCIKSNDKNSLSLTTTCKPEILKVDLPNTNEPNK